MRQILLLTATIAPRAGTQYLSHADPARRLGEYKTSLEFYLNELKRGTFDHIVFAENSGHPIEVLHDCVSAHGLSHAVSFVHVEATRSPDNPRMLLELDLISQALRQVPLESLDDDARIWKVTGRYIIRNIRSIVVKAPKNVDCCFHIRNHPRRWAEFFIAGFNTTGFEKIFRANMPLFVPREPTGEEILYTLITPPSGVTISARLARIPRIEGVRGFDGRRYGDLRGKVGYIARSVLNVVAPSLWI